MKYARFRLARKPVWGVCLGVVASSCGGRLSSSTDTDRSVTFSGAGDIAVCYDLASSERTAALLDSITEGLVFTAGDNSNEDGALDQYVNCFDRTWGRHKHRIRPTMGNHDATNGGAAYYEYFGKGAGEPGRGYYAFDHGSWRIYALNSEVAADNDSDQMRWLEADLDANSHLCSLAYWHAPLFSSASFKTPRVRDLWDKLQVHGAEIIINGHSHLYERFSEQDSMGKLDSGRGIREFVVGTGGAGFYHPIAVEGRANNSEVVITDRDGVLRLELHDVWYEWTFVSSGPNGAAEVLDRGTRRCHP